MQPELGTFHSPLGRLLYDLLYEGETQKRFLAGEAITDDEGEQRALAVIELDELRDACGRIRRDLLAGSGDMAGGLGSAYQRTLAALQEAAVDVRALADAYLRSPEFVRFRELPTGAPAWCAEEAFYRYMVRTAEAWGCDALSMRAVLRHEFLVALLSVLAVNRDPAFEVAEPALTEGPAARYVIATYEREAAEAVDPKWARDEPTPVLYAATERGFVCGPVTTAVVELLRAGSWATVLGDLDGEEPPEAMVAAATRLIDMGLMEAGQ